MQFLRKLYLIRIRLVSFNSNYMHTSGLLYTPRQAKPLSLSEYGTGKIKLNLQLDMAKVMVTEFTLMIFKLMSEMWCSI